MNRPLRHVALMFGLQRLDKRHAGISGSLPDQSTRPAAVLTPAVVSVYPAEAGRDIHLHVRLDSPSRCRRGR